MDFLSNWGWALGFILTIVFQAGGLVWLTKNHFAHVNKELREHRRILLDLLERISRIEGCLGKH